VEPHRQEHRLGAGRRREAGITVIGFLVLASLFGLVGFAGLKLVPMYLQYYRLDTVLKDVQKDLDGRNATPGQIRSALNRRFDVEGIQLPRDSVNITQSRNGYAVQIQYESRARYLADIWLLVTFDKQVEIQR